MLLAAMVSRTTVRADGAEQILQKMRDTYTAMKSYADTGVIVNEYGGISDRHTFSTSFSRAPRRFLLDFRKQGGDRYVIWADANAFHTWWKTTGQQTDYANPNNAPAISMSGRNTQNSGLKIPALLFSKVNLGGDFNNFADVALDGTEDVGGRRCNRLIGRASDRYAATDKEVNIRKMTLWIDAESSLIRQVREEWKGTPGSITRITTTYQPQANPTLDDAKFAFTPPQQP
jgi:outer membrane lipoprotein-sorting protein